MGNNLQRNAVAAAAFAAALFAHPLAHAHIDMTGPLKARGGDQKNFPCDGGRGDGTVYTFEPGTIITLTLNESIPHPSYFRIAFDNDGEDAFVEPKSIKPIDPNRGCPSGPKDQCGQSDFCNVKSADGGPTVLWDNLDPHLAGATKSYTWTVKLPNVECENCTIQVLQIMEDDAFHGDYCPTGSCDDNGVEDIYHRCIDIKLKKGTTNSPGVATAEMKNMGIQCVEFGAPAPTAGTGAAGASGAAGAAGGAATAGAGATAGTMASAAGTSSAGMTSGSAGAGGSTSTVPPATPKAGTGASGTSNSAAAGSTSTAPTTAGSMQNASMATAGTAVPAAAGSAAPVTAPPAESSGCSVQNAGDHGNRAGWLVLVGALAFLRRRRFLRSAQRRLLANASRMSSG